MILKAVIAALDGVFINIERIDAEAIQYAIKQVVEIDISPAVQIRDFGNLTFSSKISMLHLSGRVSWDQLELIRSLYHEKIFEIFSETIKPDNDIILVGEYIRSRGLSLACVTNKDYQVALFGLDRCGVLPHVQYIVTPDQVLMGKPAAYCYDAALNYCEAQPDEVLVVESDILGVEAARQAGCRVHQLRRGTRLTVSHLFTLIGDNNV